MGGRKEVAELAVAIEIEGFLSGKSDGTALFQALYGAVAEEPVPERLLTVLRATCASAFDAADAAVPALDAAAS
ncbi:MAG: hypothetical protein ACLQJR_08015 [Stellaceae bacterium]